MYRPWQCSSLLCLLICILTPACNSSKGAPPAPRPDKGAPKATTQTILQTKPSLSSTASDYAGSGTCRKCHERFYHLWETSPHGKAMQRYSADFGRNNLSFDGISFEIGNTTFTPDASGVIIAARDGRTQQYPIRYAIGGKHIYYFLTPLSRGRLQVLPIGYDVLKKNWFDVIHSDIPHGTAFQGRPVNWMDRTYTFNTTCYNCHVSGLNQFYNSATDTYTAKWREPGIDCETCHGPAAAHNAACASAPADNPPSDLHIIRGGSSFTAQQNSDSCATCHAKLIPLGTRFTPGNLFFDHFDLITPDHADYYPDGRDLGENYTFTAWLSSTCAHKGRYDCLHCHTVSGRYRQAESPNQSCIPCHLERVQNISRHSHHPQDAKGAPTCVACHMPKTTLARIPRSDHSMSPPLPALSQKYGSPNACHLCHQDRDDLWANRHVLTWFGPERTNRALDRAETLDAARRQDWTAVNRMLAYAADDTENMVFRVALLRLLSRCNDSAVIQPAITQLSSPQPLVRAAAAQTLAGRENPKVIHQLFQALADPVRLVRIRAFESLNAMPNEIGARDTAVLATARQEYISFLTSRSDDSAAHFKLGNFYMDQRQFSKAESAFQTALKLSPKSADTLVNLALARRGQGHIAAAASALKRAIQNDASSEAAHLNLAMLYGETGKTDLARQHFKTALQLNPKNAQAAFNVCVMDAPYNWPVTRAVCETACRQAPDNARYVYTLAYFYYQYNEFHDAVAILQRGIRKFSADSSPPTQAAVKDMKKLLHAVQHLD